jgi:1,4-dihydroxy-2-naphthoyl-CoA hydrolase
MAIWFDPDITMDNLHGLGKGTMSEHLGMEWVEIGADFLKAKMPVDHRTKQPYGLLHGGASCVLAETLGSVASAMVTDHSKFYCVGLEINANHVRMAKEGYVTGTVTALHLGASTHVWDIRITDEKGKLVCVSRLTVAVIPRKD